MFKKIGRLVALGGLLVGCAGPDLDRPEGVVEEFFNRLENEDAAEVEALLCPEFQKNLNFDLAADQKADLNFDLKYQVADESDDIANVNVWGTVESTVENAHITVHQREKRDEERAWTVQVFKINGEWRVCGGNEAPLILRFLDLRRQADALE